MTNTTMLIEDTNGLIEAGTYSFDAQGKMTIVLRNGIVDGYYYVDDVKTAAGLLLIDGAYYYAGSDGKIAVSQSRWVSETNDLLSAGTYRFDAEGKAIMTTEIVDENGTLYYYQEGKRTADLGVIEIEEELYYVGSGAKVAADESKWVSKTNDLVTAGTYRFDADGKMILTTEVADEDGTLYYYENGKRTSGVGLIQLGEDYYYIDGSAVAAADTTIWVEDTNDLMPKGTYSFGVDGKMILE